jgi:lysyl-tRNA synthetase class 2
MSVASDKAFMDRGVPAAWIELLRAANIQTVDDLKTAIPTKLHNTLNGLRKKHKLNIPALQLSEVQAWIEREN